MSSHLLPHDRVQRFKVTCMMNLLFPRQVTILLRSCLCVGTSSLESHSRAAGHLPLQVLAYLVLLPFFKMSDHSDDKSLWVSWCDFFVQYGKGQCVCLLRHSQHPKWLDSCVAHIDTQGILG